MRLRYWMILTVLAMSPVAMSADLGDRASPVDNNAACMDRTTDASSGNCVVKDEGTPRHTYAPKASTIGQLPAPAPATARDSSTVRKAPAASK
jgi:hypothetical protein